LLKAKFGHLGRRGREMAVAVDDHLRLGNLA
jgi:hypothetical protein